MSDWNSTDTHTHTYTNDTKQSKSKNVSDMNIAIHSPFIHSCTCNAMCDVAITLMAVLNTFYQCTKHTSETT